MNADSDKISAPRHQVKHIRNVRIPVRDGTRLAADLFVPDLIAGLVEGDPSPLPLGEAARRAGESSANVVPPRSGASWPSPHPSPLPAGEGTSFPALLEYLPYRKDDNTAPRWDAH